MALGAEVVDLVGPDDAQQFVDGAGVVEVAVVEEEFDPGFVGIAVEVVDPAGVEGGGAANHAVDLVPLGQQQFRQVGAVLAGDPCDEGFFHGTDSPCTVVSAGHWAGQDQENKISTFYHQALQNAIKKPAIMGCYCFPG